MFLTENNKIADLDQSINQSIYLCQYVGWGCPQRLMNETYDNIIPIEYRKIPKISPEAYIFQRPFLRSLFSEGLILGGAYLRREICVYKSIGLAL